MPYGYIGSMRTQPGRRSDVVSILLADIADLRAAGCDSYIVTESNVDDDMIVVMEVWAGTQRRRRRLGSRHTRRRARVAVRKTLIVAS